MRYKNAIYHNIDYFEFIDKFFGEMFENVD